MKISNNFSIQKTLSNRAFNGKLIDFSKIRSSKRVTEKSPSNPAYYQVLSRIERPDLKYEVELEEFGKCTLNIKSKDILNYLSDEDGRIKEELLEKFVSLYKMNLKKFFSANKEHIKSVKEILNTPKVINFSKTGNNSESVIRQTAKYLLGILTDNKSDIQDNAYKRTLRLFQISKTETGYDFSSLEEKNKLIDKIEYSSEEDDYFDSVVSGIKKYALNTDGSLNFDLAENAVSIINTVNTGIETGRIIKMLKQSVPQNPENSTQITSVVKELCGSCLACQKDSKIEDFFEMCFDDKKFNTKKAEILIGSIKSINKRITDSLRNIEAGRKILAYDNIVKTASDLLSEYLESITDDNGNLKSDIITIDEFIESKIGV